MKKTAFVLLCLIVTQTALAEDWPQWRGPRLDGSSTEKGLPLMWTATENLAWKTPLPGIGHSSPIVVGDRVFVTTCLVEQKSVEKSRLLLCLDRASGKVLWQREVVVIAARAEARAQQLRQLDAGERRAVRLRAPSCAAGR